MNDDDDLYRRLNGISYQPVQPAYTPLDPSIFLQDGHLKLQQQMIEQNRLISQLVDQNMQLKDLAEKVLKLMAPRLVAQINDCTREQVQMENVLMEIVCCLMNNNLMRMPSGTIKEKLEVLRGGKHDPL